MVGMPPGLRFPKEYRHLRLPFDECVTDLRRQFDTWTKELAGAPLAIMSQHDLLTAGATETALARATGIHYPNVAARRLELRGLLQRDGGRPRKWTYTPEGLRTAEDIKTQTPRHERQPS